MIKPKKPSNYDRLTKSIAQAVTILRLYSFEHPLVKNKVKEVYKIVNKFITDNKKLIFAESPEGAMLINGEELEIADNMTAHFVKDFRNLKMGSIELLAGLTLEEFHVFIDLLNNTNNLQGKEGVKEFLKSKKANHIIPASASYKIVNERQAIVDPKEVVNIKNIPPEIVKKFNANLKEGKIDKNALVGNHEYQTLSHDPETLSKILISEEKNTSIQPDHISKILWSIGDYLVDEAETPKSLEKNSKTLGELQKLVAARAKNIKGLDFTKIYKVFLGISSALLIKKLITSYIKNKKQQISIIDNLKKAIKEIPPESHLFQSAKQDWAKIDHKEIDTNIF